MSSQVIAALITGFVTILGWNVLTFLNNRKENQTKLLQFQIEHISRQIEELYGPLFNLVNQLNMYYDTKEKITEVFNTTDQKKEIINIFIRENYFYQLHDEIRKLIKNKYHLIDNNELPNSYRDYLLHSTQETLQIDIWNKLQIDTSIVKGIVWPDQFDIDTKKHLDSLKYRYNQLLSKLN